MTDAVRLFTEHGVFAISQRNAGVLIDEDVAHTDDSGALLLDSDVQPIVLDLEIDNTYELYEEEHTSFTGVVLPAPPQDSEDEMAFDDWGREFICPFTGVGHEDGDSWYDVLVTASSNPELIPVDTTFDFGY